MLRLTTSEIINAKLQFEKDMKKAIVKHPDNQELLIIQNVFSEVFSTKNNDDATREEVRTTEAQNDDLQDKT